MRRALRPAWPRLGARRLWRPRLATLMVVVASGPLLAPTCPGETSAVRSGGGVDLRLSVENAAGEPATRFDPLETVVLALSVHNPGAAPIHFELRSAQTHDVAIADESGRELWRWSSGRGFAQMLTDFSLSPDETRRLEARWNQHGDDGQPVPPSRYHAIARLAAREANESVSASFTIE